MAQRRTSVILLYGLLTAAAGGNAVVGRAPDDIEVRVAPQPAFIERNSSGQYLTWDFRITNHTTARVLLSRIDVSVLDRSGRLASRRFLSVDGAIPPGIETIPRREIDPGRNGRV